MAYIPEDARWYLADILLEHTVENDPRNVVHTNTHLIEAESPDQAYEKAVALGRAGEMEYANTDGKQVRTVFRGLRSLSVIHEPLEDGAELAYYESVGVSEDELRRWALPREELGVFRPRRRKRDIPNYEAESVMRMLEDLGFDRELIDQDEDAPGDSPSEA
ncbi:MAG: DUF4288 domain-containing protein [Isosphaeraceae bacterium]